MAKVRKKSAKRPARKSKSRVIVADSPHALPWLLSLLALCLAAIAYLPVLSATFLGGSGATGTRVFSGWAPLAEWSFLGQWALSGLEPALVLRINVILHALAAALVVPALLPLLGLLPSFCAAVLCAVHPLLSEAIVTAAGRSQLLGALFLLAALALAGIETARRGGAIVRDAGIAVALLAALLSGEGAFAAPLVVVSAQLLNGAGGGVRRILPAAMVSVVSYCVLRVACGAPAPSSQIFNMLSLPECILSLLALPGRALSLVLLPYPLASIYPADALLPFPLSTEKIVGYCAMLLLTSVAVALAVVKEARRSALWWCCWWFLAAILASVLAPLDSGAVFAERNSYIAAYGVVAALSSGIPRFFPGSLAVCASLLLAGISLLYTHGVLPVWSSQSALSRHQIELAPGDLGARLRYAIALRESGEFTSAEQCLGMVLAQQPGNPDALYHLAEIAQARGERERAGVLYGQVLAHSPNHVVTLAALGKSALFRNDAQEAAKRYGRVLELAPDSSEGLRGMVGVYLLRGESERALRLLDQLIEREPRQRELQVLREQVLSEHLVLKPQAGKAPF